MAPAKKTPTKKATAKSGVAKKTVAKKVASKKTVAKAPKAPTTVKTAAKAKPRASSSATAKKAAPAAVHGLHYDKARLEDGYSQTFRVMMVATAISVGFIFLYFMVFVVYLGGFSHSKHGSFHEKFNDRIDISSSYDGKPLPVYENN